MPNNKVKIYLIDCMGYSQQDVKEISHNSLWDYLIDFEKADCRAFWAV